MRAVDARWAAGPVMDAAVALTVAIDGAMEDVEGALAAGDHATAAEIATIGLRHVALIARSLEGSPLGIGDPEVQLAVLAAASDPALAAAAERGPATATGADAAQARRAELAEAAAELRGRLPFDVPLMRTPEGFFPAVRAARQLEALRSRLHLDPFGWDGMAE